MNKHPLPSDWRDRVARGWTTPARPGQGEGSAEVGVGELHLKAIIGAWNEDDIIFALVKHLRSQGVDQVFVLDDRSDDSTRIEAAAAGAFVHRVSTGAKYSEEGRTTNITEFMKAQSDAFWHQRPPASSDLWWLVADADEFPVGPAGTTIREVVASTPTSVDVIGAHVLDHFPDPNRPYNSGEPPLGYFPLAIWHTDPYCPRGHWKHPLIRVSPTRRTVTGPGQHIAITADNDLASEHWSSVLIHHFPIRSRSKTEGRLRKLLATGGRYRDSSEEWQRWHGHRRLEMLDAVYEQRFADVPSGFTPSESGLGVDPRPWPQLIEEMFPEEH